MSISIYMKGVYEELHALRVAENKANFIVLSNTKGVEKGCL